MKFLALLLIVSLLSACPMPIAKEQAENQSSRLLQRSALTLKVQSWQHYRDFMLKHPAWTHSLYEQSFPRGTFDNCLNNGSVVTEKIQYQGRGGTVKGWLVYPKQAIKSPLILFNRGGAAKWGRLLQSDLLTFCNLAESGYTVMASDFRGDSTSAQADRTDLGLGDVYDSLDLLDIARETRGNKVDLNKVILWGFSRGTMISAMMLTHSKQFAGVIAVSTAPDSLNSHRRDEFEEHVYPLVEPKWHQLNQHQKDELLKKISPVFLIDAITGKPEFLFLHSATDQRTPLAPVEHYISMLKDKGFHTELTLYESAGHGMQTVYPTMIKDIKTWLKRFQ